MEKSFNGEEIRSRMITDDPMYKKLLADFIKARKAYKIAWEHYGRVVWMTKKELSETQERRPVGSSTDFRIPRGNANNPAAKTNTEKKVMRIYMGDILGWVCLNLASGPMPAEEDPTAYFDPGKTFNAIALKFYWNAKHQYKRCELDLKHYVQREIDIHFQQAASSLNREAFRQLGLDLMPTDASDDATAEVEGACKDALAYYKSIPEPKTNVAILMLLLTLTQAQLVDLESDTVNNMMIEFDALFIEGTVTRE